MTIAVSSLWKRLASVVLLLTMTACATQPASQADLSRVKSIGLVSAIGAALFYQKVGLTVFQNETTSGRTAHWGIDTHVIAGLTKELGSRYLLTTVDLDHEKLYREAGGWGNFVTAGSRLRGALKDQPPAVDAYLLVASSISGDFIGGSNQRIAGLGIYRRGWYGMQLYVASDMYLIDARDFGVIGQAPLEMDYGSPTMKDVVSGRRWVNIRRPYRPVDKSLHRARVWDDFTVDQKAWIKMALKELLSASIPVTLKQIGLTPAPRMETSSSSAN